MVNTYDIELEYPIVDVDGNPLTVDSNGNVLFYNKTTNDSLPFNDDDVERIYPSRTKIAQSHAERLLDCRIKEFRVPTNTIPTIGRNVTRVVVGPFDPVSSNIFSEKDQLNIGDLLYADLFNISQYPGIGGDDFFNANGVNLGGQNRYGNQFGGELGGIITPGTFSQNNTIVTLSPGTISQYYQYISVMDDAIDDLNREKNECEDTVLDNSCKYVIPSANTLNADFLNYSTSSYEVDNRIELLNPELYSPEQLAALCSQNLQTLEDDLEDLSDLVQALRRCRDRLKDKITRNDNAVGELARDYAEVGVKLANDLLALKQMGAWTYQLEKDFNEYKDDVENWANSVRDRFIDDTGPPISDGTVGTDTGGGTGGRPPEI